MKMSRVWLVNQERITERSGALPGGCATTTAAAATATATAAATTTTSAATATAAAER